MDAASARHAQEPEAVQRSGRKRRWAGRTTRGDGRSLRLPGLASEASYGRGTVVGASRAGGRCSRPARIRRPLEGGPGRRSCPIDRSQEPGLAFNRPSMTDNDDGEVRDMGAAENAEVVRRGYRAFNSGDLDALRDVFAGERLLACRRKRRAVRDQAGARDAVLAYFAELGERSRLLPGDRPGM